MATTTGETGDTVEYAGRYQFLRYTDGTTTPSPTSEERIIPVQPGDKFPPVRSANKGAWWGLISS